MGDRRGGRLEREQSFMSWIGKRRVAVLVPWRLLPIWPRIARVTAIVGWCVAMASLLTVGGIETVATGQPEIAGAV
jgi:hypothetical protein